MEVPFTVVGMTEGEADFAVKWDILNFKYPSDVQVEI